jgi:type I restriction enzyme M protein
MFRIIDEHVFPFIRALNSEGTSYARHMRDARFQIPGAALLGKVVDKLDKLDMVSSRPGLIFAMIVNP